MALSDIESQQAPLAMACTCATTGLSLEACLCHFRSCSPPPSPPAGAAPIDSSDEEAERVVPASPGVCGQRKSSKKRGKGLSPDQLADLKPPTKEAAQE